MTDRTAKVAQYLSSYEPSLREKIGNVTYDVAQYLGFPHANRLRNDVQNTVDFIPFVGDAVGVNDAARDYEAGNYGMAAAGLGLTAVGAIPGVGDAASGALRALPSSISLNIPSIPPLDVLQKYASTETVPLDMARGSQPRMDWEKFNSGQYGTPMFQGYEDMPVAVMRNDGEYIIYDGHHRAVKAMNEGKSSLPMYVVPASVYDPSNAGVARSAARDSASDEELLRQLGF